LRWMDIGESPHPKAQPKSEIITIQDLYRQYNFRQENSAGW
jgi:hypothetical protein